MSTDRSGPDPTRPDVRALLDRFPVDPAPGAEQRIWRRLERGEGPARRRAERLRWSFAAAGVAVLAAAVLWVWGAPDRSSSTRAELVRAEGLVEIGRSPSDLARATIGQELDVGALVSTGENARSSLSLSGGMMVELDRKSRVVIARLDPHVELTLLGGALSATVLAEPPAVPVTVHAGAWSVTGISAQFELQRVGAEHVSVSVSRGELVLRGPTGERTLSTDQHFSSAPVIAAGASPPPAPEAGTVEPPREAAPAPREAPAAPAIRAKRSRRLERARLEPLTSPPEVPPPATEPPGAAPPPSPSGAPTPAPEVQPAAAADPPTPEIPPGSTPPPQPASPPSDEELYRRASADPDLLRARRAFDAIAARSGAFAELAAHQAARIDMRFGRYAEALERWNRVVAQFPRGALDQEARLNQLECALRIGRLAAARQALERFSATHPGSERTGELEFLRGDLARRSGHCAPAIDHYRAAANSRYADDALYFTAWCQLQLGAHEAGRQALTVYLERFPSGHHAADARAGLRSEPR